MHREATSQPTVLVRGHGTQAGTGKLVLPHLCISDGSKPTPYKAVTLVPRAGRGTHHQSRPTRQPRGEPY